MENDMEQNTKNQSGEPTYNHVNFFMIIKGGASEFIQFVEMVFDAHENKIARTPDRNDEGTLIHAEIQLGNSMILVADSKPNWPFTPAFPQVFVENAREILMKATANGAEIITEVSEFYGGLNIARFKDPWQNIWWLFEKSQDVKKPKQNGDSNKDWHDEKPSYIYKTIMEAMRV